MSAQVRFAFAKATRSSRAATEDRAEVFEDGDARVIVVADGAGGMRGGAAASAALIDAVRSRLSEPLFDPTNIGSWSALFEETDVWLARRLIGETTALLVIVGEHGIVGLSAGDSEAWIVSANGIDRLTEAQPRARVGSGRCSFARFQRRDLDGTLVVGTDGLFKHADGASIVAACLDRGPEAAEELAMLPRLASGRYPDDVAVVVVAHGS